MIKKLKVIMIKSVGMSPMKRRIMNLVIAVSSRYLWDSSLYRPKSILARSETGFSQAEISGLIEAADLTAIDVQLEPLDTREPNATMWVFLGIPASSFDAAAAALEALERISAVRDAQPDLDEVEELVRAVFRRK